MNKKYYSLINETLYSFKCDNGLEVYLLPKNDYMKTYAIFSTRFGSCNNMITYNNTNLNVIDGAAHFLEHKMFEKKDYDVMDIFSKQQASSNAFTSFDKTAYLFSATNNVYQNIETLLDFVQDLELSDESVAKEKPIIASEIKMYEDDVNWRSFFDSLDGLYHHNPIKIDIAGSIESINEITKEDLYKYHELFYHPSNMTLFVCGNFDLDTISKTIKDNQNKKDFAKIDLSFRKVEEPKEIHQKYIEKHMDVSIDKVSYSFKVNDYLLEPLKQELSLNILLELLFSKKTAWYDQLIDNDLMTEDYGYSYSQDVINDYRFIQLSFSSNHKEELIKQLDMYFNNKEYLIDKDDFKTIKARYKGDFIRMFNNPESIANSFIGYHFQGFDLFEILNTINDISLDDLNNLTNLFDMNYQCVSVISPIKK